jgi:hypothetical protein
MSLQLVHAGVIAGILLFLIGIGVCVIGVLPQILVPIVGPALLLILGVSCILTSVIWFQFTTLWDNVADESKCSITTSLNTRIVSRLRGRDHNENLEKTPLEFQFQELFYEWQLALTPLKTVSKVVMEITNLQLNDMVKARPADAAVSDRIPRWMSGFQEHRRKQPDFFSRVISIESIDRDQLTTIVFRRALTSAAVSPNEIIRISDLRAPGCLIAIPTIDANSESVRLTKQAEAFAKERFSKTAPETGLPLGVDVGDLPDGMYEGSVEGWCENESRTKFTFSHLEVKKAADANTNPSPIK